MLLLPFFKALRLCHSDLSQYFKWIFGLNPFTVQPFCGLKDNLHSVRIDSCSVSSRSLFGIRCSCGRSCPDPQQSLPEINGLLGISVPVPSAVRYAQDNVCKVTLSLSLTFCYHAAIWQEPKWILAEWKMNGLLIGSRSVLNDGCGTSPYIHSRAGRHSGFYTPHKSRVTVLNRSELWPHLQPAVGGRFSFRFHF